VKKKHQPSVRSPRPDPTPSTTSGNSVPVWAALAGLCILTVVVFWPVGGHAFINFDDTMYVTENRHVREGLTAEGIRWAFQTFHASNWHPLTWLSHMVDVSLFGLDPGKHHGMSVAIHVVNALLVFLLLRKMTGRLWPSAIVAALFAVHPTRVESVAWVAERKDVLSVALGLATIWAYVVYTQKKTASQPALPRYLTVFLLFAAGLMAKPMLVTLPALLLLLDYWPLNRARTFQTGWRCLIEKIPLFLLSAASSGVTYIAQQRGGSVSALEEFALPQRVANALVSYAGYIAKTLWPHNLAIFYPYPVNGVPTWQVVGAAIALAAVTAAAIRLGRTRPWFLVGWLWFLISLTPVIGIIQVGGQAMADRYTYIPTLGLFIAIVWEVYHLQSSAAAQNSAATIRIMASVAVIAACAYLARAQVAHWKDSVSVFSRAIAVTDRNHVAHGNLGLALSAMGRTDEAIAHLKRSVEIMPDSEISLNVLGGLFITQRRFQEAEIELSKALSIKPDFGPAHFNLGLTLAELGRTREAIEHYKRALAIDPDSFKAHSSLGSALAKDGRPDEAMSHFARAIEINPVDSHTHNNLGIVLADQGKLEDALRHFSEGIRNAPGDPVIRFNAGVILQRLGRTTDALAEFETVLKLNPQHAGARQRIEEIRGH
jgi:tetratricopeptide (TPR) repeat protein